MDLQITVSNGTPILQEGAQTLRGTQRIDRYMRPGRLRKPPWEVEKWRLEDGRQLKIGRPIGKTEWIIEELK